MDAGCAFDEGVCLAGGKVVWAWHPDAGVKFALRSAGDGGQKARSTGESTLYAVKTIAWGMLGDSGVTC